MPIGFILVVVAALGAIWFVAIPKDFRAWRWHVTHIALLFAPLVALSWGSPEIGAGATLFIKAGGVLLALCVLTWAVATVARNHSYMDIAYPLLVLGVAVYALSQSVSGFSPHALLLFALVALWAARLVSHAVRTNLKVEQEPYASLRQRYGKRWFVWSFFAVYALQGAILWIWCAPVVFAMAAPNGALGWPHIAGAAMWLTGFLFQALGDLQLKRFKQDPANKGRLMQTGLWSRTRHPNYFGEALMWAGYFLIALQHPWGWATIFAPIYVYWFMGYGSAAPGNERHMRKTRPEYDDYARRTPRMFPRLLPRPEATR